jgi:GT2 family glycosyltransferase
MKISIIVLSFNNYEETTGKCLAVLSNDPDFVNWDVIVVDNASDEQTQKKLSAARLSYPGVTFIFNSQNVGYAAGNNIGLNKAVGDVFILLNSDAFPPIGMIARLAHHLVIDPQLGMIGPITNAAGNEQCIYTKASNEAGKIEEGLQYAENGGNEVLSAYRLDFHCVAVTRQVINQVGLLDEAFGRGYYEDLDYSLRVKDAGYKLGIAEDTFVYHRGSASFGKIPREIKQLLKRNKKLIKRKHGAKLDIPHKRQANLAVLMQYLNLKNTGKTISVYRVSNRLHQANTELPKGWFKRWRYLRQLKKISDAFDSTKSNLIT